MSEQNFRELNQNISKVIKKNKSDLREKISHLATGHMEEDEFLLYIIKEFTRMQSEISSYAKYFLKRHKHLQSKELIEDNITKAAIIEILFDLIPQSPKKEITLKLQTDENLNSDLIYSAENIH